MDRIEIPVRMKRGGKMLLLAQGTCIRDRDYAGNPCDTVDDFELFWPGRARDKKLTPVKDALIADIDEAQTEFWEAMASRSYP